MMESRRTSRERNGERGSIFTVLLGAVALTAVVGVTAFQTLSGPVMTAVRVKNKTQAETQMLAAAKITLVDAINQAGSGDCDGDTFIEPVAWRAGSGPTNAGLIPLTIGAPTTDPWGTSYGYCVWDVGPTFDDAACGGAGALRLNGSDTPLAGNADTQTVMAIVSAGPDRQFQTSCINYVDATTSVVTKGGDDLVLKYSYNEAGSISDGLWGLKLGDPDVATTTKDVEVGSNLSIDSATGQLWAGGGVELGDEGLVTICDGTNVGLMRYNTTEAAVEVCDGVDWVQLQGDGGSVTGGLVGYWKLDDGAGATAADSSGNGLDGTVNGATWTGSGLMDGAITFDGVNDYIEVADDALLDVTNITMSAWVYKTTSNQADYGNIFARQYLTGAFNIFYMSYDNTASDEYTCGIRTAAGEVNAQGPASTGDANTWVHVACTYDGSNIRMYKNGTQIASAVQTGDILADTTRMTVGCDNNAGVFTPDEFLAARLDDVRLYNRALSVDEIATLGSVISELDGLSDAYTDYGASNNLIVGRIGVSDMTSGALSNTFIGESAGAVSSSSTATTQYNTAIGYQSLRALTSSKQNTAVGFSALPVNTTGESNTAIGGSAMLVNSQGSYNVAMGSAALQFNTLGNYNVAVGGNALRSMVDGDEAVAVGYNALYNNTANGSTAVGFQALFENRAKAGNTAIGYEAMRYADSTTTAGNGYNTAVGYQALFGSTTAANNTGTENTAVGYNALLAYTSGSGNTAFGAYTMTMLTTSGFNTAVGDYALSRATGASNVGVGYLAGYGPVGGSTGSNNTFIGKEAGTAYTTGSNNVMIGYQAGDSVTTGGDNILIGNGVDTPAIGTGNHLNIGNTIYGDLSNDYVGIGTAAPDKRLHIAGDLDDDGIKLESFNGTDLDGAYLLFTRSRGETDAAKTIVASGDEIGKITFQSYDGSTYQSAAHIIAAVDGTPGAGDTPSRLAFWTTPDGTSTAVERMRLDDSGNLGIGTTNPTELLHLAGNTEEGIRFDVATSVSSNLNPFIALRRSRGTAAAPTVVSSGDNLGEISFYGHDGVDERNAALIEVRVDGTPGASDMPARMEFHVQADGAGAFLGDDASPPELVIKSDGKIGMGIAAPDSLLHVYDDGNNAYYEALKVEGEGEPGVLLSAASATSWYNPLITALRSRGTPSAPTIVSSGDTLFELQVRGEDGTAWRDAAYIAVLVDGTPGANDMPGRLEFHTQADGSGGALESTTPEMVIKNNGAIGIGTATPNEGKVEVKGGSVCVDTNSDDTASSCITTESDERLKKNIRPITNALEKVLKIRGVEFDWRWDEFDIASKWKNQPHGIGVIAQEVEKVFPEAMGEEDQGFKTVEYRYLVAPLIEAVRELHEQDKERNERMIRMEEKLKLENDIR